MTPTIALDARLINRAMTGDSSYWRGLVSGLAAVATDVQILLFSNTPRPEGIPETRNVTWFHLPSSHERWWSLVQFPLAARKAGARVLHTQYTLSPLAGRNSVTTVHDISFFIGPQWFKPKDRWLLQWQVPASIKRAARVLAVSETSKREIEQYVPCAGGKVRVTPNALGDNIRPIEPAEAAAIVDSLGIDRPYLLTVGTRWPRKNLALAVSAAHMASSPLVVTGKMGWGGDPIGPRYTGYVDDRQLTALYQCASLYLAPSYHEGFGIPLLEAFACGCPVVCSTGGALPEVSGGAAEVVGSFDPADWAARIEALLRDSSKLEAMRRRGYARVKDFDWRTTARLTLQAYREAAE